MGTWIAEQITCKLIASSVIEEGDRELYSYGFFLLISKIFFFFVAVIAGLLTDTTVESIIFYVVFGATIHITLSPRQMFALLGIPQIRPQLVMSLIMHARTPEDNH